MKLWKAISKTYTLLPTFAIFAMVTHAFPLPYTIVANVQTQYVVNNANIVTYQPHINIKCPNLLGLKCQQIINGQQVIINVFHEQPREKIISSEQTSDASTPHTAIDSATNVEVPKMYEEDKNTDENGMMKDESMLDVNSNDDENLSERYGDSDATRFSNEEEGNTFGFKRISHSNEREDMHSSEHMPNIGAETSGKDNSSIKENGKSKDYFSQDYRSTIFENVYGEWKKQSKEKQDDEDNSYGNSALEEKSKQQKESGYEEHDNHNTSADDESTTGSRESHDTNNGIGKSGYENEPFYKYMGNNPWDPDFSGRHQNNLSRENNGDAESVTYHFTEKKATTEEHDERLSKEFTTAASILTGKWWSVFQ